MSDGTFVQAIAQVVKKSEAFKTITIAGRTYSDRVLIPVKLPEPAPLSIDTLTGIQDYLKGNPDALKLADILVTVNGPASVSIWSKLTGEFQQRSLYLMANWPDPGFRLAQYYDVESFTVLLQADFRDYGDRPTILALIGNITDGVVKNFNDDGVTQDITVKKGITKRENVAVPNPVNLSPYRTFPEVDQPPSEFIFRMRSGAPAPLCALFEADGGRWRSEAVKNVKDWLTRNLPEGVVVLA